MEAPRAEPRDPESYDLGPRGSRARGGSRNHWGLRNHQNHRACPDFGPADREDGSNWKAGASVLAGAVVSGSQSRRLNRHHHRGRPPYLRAGECVRRTHFFMVPRWDSPKRTRWCSFRTEGHHLGETRARVRHEWTSTRHRVDVRRVRNGPNECDVRTSRRDECPRIGPAGAKWIVPGSTDQTGRRRQMGPSETSWAAGDKLGRPRGHTPDGAATACGQRPASIPRRHAQRESAMFQRTLRACQ